MVRLSVLLLMLLSGCVAALSPEDNKSLRDAEQLTLMAYKRVGAATVEGQEVRAAFCSVDAVLRRTDAGRFDSEGAINCEVKK